VLHTYGDPAQQIRAMRLLAAAVRVYYRVRTAHPELPFGGYYRLGVCQDVSAAVETVLHGKTLLFPITHDPAYFPQSIPADLRDQEFLNAFAALPSDRGSGMPPVDRVLGALPTTDYSTILIPGLGGDLRRVEVARALGVTTRTYPLLTALAILLLLVLIMLLTGWRLASARRRHHPGTASVT
jgi:hypothetical protein